jgi:hypothetical protein
MIALSDPRASVSDIPFSGVPSCGSAVGGRGTCAGGQAWSTSSLTDAAPTTASIRSTSRAEGPMCLVANRASWRAAGAVPAAAVVVAAVVATAAVWEVDTSRRKAGIRDAKRSILADVNNINSLKKRV